MRGFENTLVFLTKGGVSKWVWKLIFGDDEDESRLGHNIRKLNQNWCNVHSFTFSLSLWLSSMREQNTMATTSITFHLHSALFAFTLNQVFFLFDLSYHRKLPRSNRQPHTEKNENKSKDFKPLELSFTYNICIWLCHRLWAHFQKVNICVVTVG